jgi:hypothetical protein
VTSPPTEMAPFAEGPSGTTRPPSVSKAVAMLYVTFALGVLRATLIEVERFQKKHDIASILGHLCIFAGLGMLYFLIGRRKNWARLVYAVWTVLFVATVAFVVLKSDSEVPFVGVLAIGQAALQVWALVMLFRPEAAAWFKRMPVRQ